MAYSTYQHYKPARASGVTQLPRHWNAKRLRFAVRLNPSRNEVELLSDTLVSFVPMDAVGELGGLTLDAERQLDEIGAGYTYFADGDVIVAKITPCFENGKGALASGLTNGVALGTTELHVVRAGPELDAKFLFYLSISDHFRDIGESEMYGAGGQKRIPDTFIKDFRAGLPPRPEQHIIVEFLDRETARIDALIGKKRRLLELLEEKQQSAITRAVEANAGTSSRLKFHVDLLPGYAFASSEFSDDPNDIRLLRGINVSTDGIRWTESVRWSANEAETYSRFKLEAGDIVFGMDRPWIGSGVRVAQISAQDLPCLLLQRVARLRPSPELRSGYLELLLRSKRFFAHFEPELTGVSVPHISGEQILSYPFVLPSLDEQDRVLESVSRIGASCRQVSRKIGDALERLQEYRSALITNAVTGKIDVRGALERKEAAE